ncbi:hypothetical protein [Halobaculum sp. MBLA0143]|uniref:hypothetical protein n=1 Tax=Halobaculum sp. MBLA0143 TaxID=3079933 RepID=UPI0035235077
MDGSTGDTEECTDTSNDGDTTPVGLPEVPLSGEGEAAADDLVGDDLVAALTSHADGVSETTSTLAAAVEAGEVDAATLAAARTEASELLALLRDVRV